MPCSELTAEQQRYYERQAEWAESDDFAKALSIDDGFGDNDDTFAKVQELARRELRKF